MAKGHILAVNDAEAKRLVGSVMWTEKYRERLQALVGGDGLPTSAAKALPAERVLLMEPCHSGLDALGYTMYRDGVSYGFFVTVVGANPRSSTNKFQLSLYGYNADQMPAEGTLIGTSDPIPVVSHPADWYEPLKKITRLINEDSASVSFGNPYLDQDLRGPYPDGVMLGLWYIKLEPHVYAPYHYYDLRVEYTATTMTGLTEVHCDLTFDLPGLIPTVATDIDYRPSSFAWQAGTVATCLDFIDVGYGIIRATSRNMQVNLND
jgi:hypothetical protein